MCIFNNQEEISQKTFGHPEMIIFFFKIMFSNQRNVYKFKVNMFL